MKHFYLLILMSFLISCKENKATSKSEFEPSFKELKSKDEKNKILEHLDSSANVYSNYKYHVGFDGPDHWKFDAGVSEHTIYRTYQPDSAITFNINVVEINSKKTGNLDIWKMYQEHSSEMNRAYDYLESEMNTKIEDFEARKSYLKNKISLRRQFKYLSRELDFEYYTTTISYQTINNAATYTFTLDVPTVFYKERPEYYDNLFMNVYFHTNQEKLEATK